MALFNVYGEGISEFVSVKDFGAAGDGATDDSTAIQAALDSLKDTGGIIFFPVGVYLLGSSVFYYSRQTLWFENGSVVKAYSSSVGNLMRCYCDLTITEYNGTHDVLIHGAVFDGSAFGSNNTLVMMAHAKNITIENCSFNAAMLSHNIEVNSSRNVKIHNCIFTRISAGEAGEMIQLDRALPGVYPEESNPDQTQCTLIDIYENYFGPNTASPAVGNHSGTPDLVDIHDNIFDGFTGNRGAIDLSSTNLSIYNNVFRGCTIGVKSEGPTHYIHDNRFVDATTAISGTASVAHANMINGTYTA